MIAFRAASNVLPHSCRRHRRGRKHTAAARALTLFVVAPASHEGAEAASAVLS
jgi:hypothetical protein